MEKYYFLGANGKDGFRSLYSWFPPEKGAFLHIIKAGPGGGKSSFMRAIGKAAEERGFDVEYVLCSGDPDSLDGVYIPALKRAWVDGTAPHIIEPVCFGVDSDYVNLGEFCSCPVSPEARNAIREKSSEYKLMYKRAYAYLKAADGIVSGINTEFFDKNKLNTIQKRVSGILDRNLGNARSGEAKISYRYISAISCKGVMELRDEATKLCKLIYAFDNFCFGAPLALETAFSQLKLRDEEVLVCLSPLDGQIEALLLPEAELALVNSDLALAPARHIRLDTLADLSHEQKAELKALRKQQASLISSAVKKLSEAKRLHDELEALYRPYIDFAALGEFTEQYISELF